jgi:transposase
LSVVASDIFGVSGRAMMAALIAGERDPQVLADMARASMRRKSASLQEALTGRFTHHHGFLLSRMLQRIDAITADIAAVQDRIDQQIKPFAPAVERLTAIPGIGSIAAQAIIAEIGLEMTRFPTAAHLASWARFAPGINQSAGRTTKTGTGRGNRYLARSLGEAAVGAARTKTFLGERYRRLAHRRGAKRAIVAIGRSILTIIWHLLKAPDRRFVDLGPGYYDDRMNQSRLVRVHVRELRQMGYRVALEPA